MEEDLGFTTEEATNLLKEDARRFQKPPAAVQRLVTMRGAEPAMGKAMDGIVPRGLIKSLRVGEGRGATTWDEEAGVCWLLAYNGFHQNGHKNDCYKVFLRLHADDELLPSEADYVAFFESSDADDEDYEGVFHLGLLEELSAISKGLLQDARANPGTESVRTFRVNGEQIMCIDAIVEADGQAEEGWMGLRLPDNEFLADADLYEMVAGLLPEDVLPTFETQFRDRDRMPGEIVLRWDHYQ